MKIGLLDKAPDTSKDIGLLLHKALEKIAFLPFGLVIDQWRWKVFSGEIPPEKYNETWWQLRQKYQGVAPPVDRSEADFDPAAKYHVAANVPYMRYFLADILQFQFHRALSQAAGCTGPLNRCSIYGNKAAGARLNAMLEMGAEPAVAGCAGEDRRHAPDGRHRHPRLLRAAAEVAGRAEQGQAGGVVVSLDLRLRIARAHPLDEFGRRFHGGKPRLPHQGPIVKLTGLLDLGERSWADRGVRRTPDPTTADFGFFGSSRASERTLAKPTIAETPPL